MGNYDAASLVVMPLPSGPRKVVLRGGYHGRYVRSGHLVYMRKGTLLAAPFDLDRLELKGPVVPVLEGVSSMASSAGAHLALSDEGTLAYLPDSSGGREATIEWQDQDGARQVMWAAPADAIDDPRFSPDGRRLALDISDGSQRDVWVFEWERDTMSRFTFDADNDLVPLWTPDGRRLVFASARADKALNLYWQPADGAGDVQRLTESTNPQWPDTWHPDGKTLVFGEYNPQTATDLMMLTLERDPVLGWKPGKPAVLLNSPFIEGFAAFSPDGRWLAYNSNETGRDEVYVRAFPGPGGKWQVSTGGGQAATWSQTRKELFYLGEDRKLMVVPYGVQGDSLRVEKARVWSDVSLVSQAANRTFDLHPDGRRFVVVKAVTGKGESKRDHLTLVFNFGDELRRLAPTR
jgi:serine/threonine-protein kinase